MIYLKNVLKRTIYLIFFISFLPSFSLWAQYSPSSFYSNTKIDSSLNNALIFKIENSNFLKNNEYFNDIVQGYTLIGYYFSPKLVYFPAKKAKLEFGVHLLKYSGVEKYSTVLPLLSFQYKIGKSTDVVLGTLVGSTNHGIIEPLFNFEHYFTDHVENGLQFLFDTHIYKGDIWINWQQFIFKGDTSQEIFTAGISNRFFLGNKTSRHRFSIPIQTIFVHQGGQINVTSKPVTTTNNSAIGLNYTYEFNSDIFKSVSFEEYLVTFRDMSTSHQLPYISGYGIYSQGLLKVDNFNLRIAHWFGDFYLSRRGDPIFQSLSTIYPSYKEPQRALITSRVLYEKELFKGLELGAGFESYFDLYNYYIDYWYMFYINFNRDFFIKKFERK